MSDSVAAAPGAVVSETEHATTYEGATAASFEGMYDIFFKSIQALGRRIECVYVSTASSKTEEHH